MSTLQNPEQAFHVGTSPVFALLTEDQLRRITEIQPNAELIERVGVLAALANEGELAPAEQAEYEGYIEANNLIAILQAEANYRLRTMGN